MATFTGEAMRAVERARTAGSMPQKVAALEDAVAALVEELSAVLTTLGKENFSELGLKELREG